MPDRDPVTGKLLPGNTVGRVGRMTRAKRAEAKIREMENALESDETPLDFLLRIMRDRREPGSTRFAAAKAAARVLPSVFGAGGCPPGGGRAGLVATPGRCPASGAVGALPLGSGAVSHLGGRQARAEADALPPRRAASPCGTGATYQPGRGGRRSQGNARSCRRLDTDRS
jgi:hypothetical protein